MQPYLAPNTCIDFDHPAVAAQAARYGLHGLNAVYLPDVPLLAASIA